MGSDLSNRLIDREKLSENSPDSALEAQFQDRNADRKHQ